MGLIMVIDPKSFTFIRGLTAFAVAMYIVPACIGFVNGDMQWKEFSASVLPIVMILLGYWVRGEQ